MLVGEVFGAGSDFVEDVHCALLVSGKKGLVGGPVEASSGSVESHAQGPGSASEHLSCLFGGEALPGHQEQRLAVGFGHSCQDRQGFGSLGCGDARVWSCEGRRVQQCEPLLERAAPPEGAVMVADVPAGHGDQPGQGSSGTDSQVRHAVRKVEAAMS